MWDVSESTFGSLAELRSLPRMGVQRGSCWEGPQANAALEIDWRRNDDGVEVGRVIGRIVELNLVGPGIERHAYDGARGRAEAVTIKGEFLRGRAVDGDEERSLALRHVVDLHQVGTRDGHIHVVEADGVLRGATQVAHGSKAGAASAKSRRCGRGACQGGILRLVDRGRRIGFLAVAADGDLVHVGRIADRVAELDRIRPFVQANWNGGGEGQIRASTAEVQGDIRPIVDINYERTG